MRDFVKVGPSIWNSKRFKKLSDDGKLAYLNCLFSPRQNSAGIYINEIGYIMVDMKWSEDRTRAAMAEVAASALIAYDPEEGLVIIDKWFEYNAPTNPKHAMKVLSDILSIDYEQIARPHYDSFFSILQYKDWKISTKHKQILDERGIDYPETIATETPTSTPTSTSTERERETGEESPKSQPTDKNSNSRAGAKSQGDGSFKISGKDLGVANFDIEHHLEDDDWMEILLHCKRLDPHALARTYNENIRKGTHDKPNKPAAAFKAWVKAYCKNIV